MKNTITLVCLFIGSIVFAQEQTPNTQKKDTIKTEVVNVITTYAPKVTDAFKIKRKPVVSLSKDIQKKELNYQIKSVPVASTFVPKSGTLKGIDVGKQERLFDNYFSAGFGNNTTPFVEMYMHNYTPYDGEYAVGLNFIYTNDPVPETILSSSYYNIDVDLFFKQEQRYFDWHMGFKGERDMYNWYGLPKGYDFQEFVINSIESQQTYKNYKFFGGVSLQDSYINKVDAAISLFSDDYESSELNALLTADFAFPLGRYGLELEDLQVKTSLNFLGGTFARSYDDINEIKHQFFNVGIHPFYNFAFNEFDIKVGAKGYFSMDVANSKNQFFIYPDVEVNYPVIGKLANLYIGANGDLYTNSYRSLSREMPYLSPTQNIQQTNQVFNAFGGLRGILSSKINYNVQASFKNEENKALFVVNRSKSNGITTGDINGFSYKSYEYGNSFTTIYDNINTLSITGEINYDYSKELTLGLHTEFNNYTTDLQTDPWGLPQIKADVFGHYKTSKWYAGANIYFVGDRPSISFNDNNPSDINLESYIDINVNGGYHINDIFSVFLRANNIMNNSYEKHINFNVQGVQIIGGVVWKFDAIF
ncbi:hypothetical protein [Tenacibaculum geojense]|uniref:TonB-dependent receptor n=1 Tax=Tenacibaculum geojense TaxID=915352 RepID=A0ABW3JS49_9FLAO